MPLAPGTRLGAYEIESLLGAGGMGEVYRARDGRLGRSVAIKILPGVVAADPDRLARFEQEARATAALNHPNILSVFDVGAADGVHFVVSELLDGATLRDRLAASPVPTRRSVDYALQIARGLAAAHERGIVHRDLKPENVFVTRDERVKILDFGLAKIVERQPVAGTLVQTMPMATGAGTIVGTVGYMAPEQVRGLAVDARTDIFAFGAILYELLTGERAFSGASPADTISAVLKDDPPLLGDPAKLANGGLQRIVQRCLEKSSEQRFQSAHDLAFALEAVMRIGSGVVASVDAAPPLVPRWRRWWPAAMILLAAAAGLIAGALIARRAIGPGASAGAAPSFRQLTFTRGAIFGARFASDGRTVVYSAGPVRGRLFLTRIDSVGSTPLPIEGARLFAVSPNAELVFGLAPPGRMPPATVQPMRLAAAPLLGGASRPMEENVTFADWGGSGQPALVRAVGSHQQLEFPPGTVLAETEGEFGFPRVSPSGEFVAYLDWPVKDDDRGTVVIIDRQRRKTTVSRVWEALRGLAWTPDGAQVWYSATSVGTNYAIHAAAIGRGERRVYSAPTGVVVEDIGRDGKVLLSQYDRTAQVSVWRSGDAVDREISWLDFSFVRDVSADGSRVLISSSGQGSSPVYDVYVCGTDGSGATRIGEGQAQQFSPDGRSVLSVVYGPPSRLLILPVGTGTATAVATGGVSPAAARWLRDGRHILVMGAEGGKRQRGYVVDVAGGAPRAFTPEGITFVADRLAVSPDDSRVVLRAPDGAFALYPLDGGAPSTVQGIPPDAVPIGWASDGRHLVLQETSALPHLFGLDPTTGARETLLDVHPADRTVNFGAVLPFRDGAGYAANYGRLQMTLFVADNLR